MGILFIRYRLLLLIEPLNQLIIYILLVILDIQSGMLETFSGCPPGYKPTEVQFLRKFVVKMCMAMQRMLDLWVLSCQTTLGLQQFVGRPVHLCDCGYGLTIRWLSA